MAKKSKTLGRAELELLQHIAKDHPTTVRQVAEQWGEPNGLARTTILTMMDRLKEKGFLTRKKVENVYHYSPKQSIGNVLHDVVSDFVQGVLGGSLAPFTAYLNQANDLDPEELKQLRAMVRQLDQRAKPESNQHD